MTIFLVSPDTETMVPADGRLHVLLAPPTVPELRKPAPAKSPLEPRRALWGYFYPAWATDARPLRIAEGLDISMIARDPQARVEPEFRIADTHRTRTLFWASIFAEYTNQMKVLHDRNDPSLVYGYIDFTPLYAKKSPFVAAVMAEHLEAEIVEKLGGALKRIGGVRRAPKVLDAENEGRLKAFLAERGHNDRACVRALVEDLRSQTGQANEFAAALNRSGGMLTQIEAIFRDHGLPRALARIPFIESSFNTSAKSKVGAMGLWQIIPRTAKALISDDEREWIDPLIQTHAAARLLRDYRRHLPNWEAAVTSYNAGIGRVSKLLRASPKGGAVHEALVTEEAERRGVGFAGRNYYAELLAANLVEAYRSEIFVPATLEERRANLSAEIASFHRGSCWTPRPLERVRHPRAYTALAKFSNGEIDFEALLASAKRYLIAEN